MKIVLLYPSWSENYGKFTHFARISASWPPLSLAYLAAMAEKLGHEVKIIDGQIESLSIEETVNRTMGFNPDLIGITASTPFYHVAETLARIFKDRTSTPIAIGGPHITILREEAFSNFDYGFIGQAEESWPLFLTKYEDYEDISNIKGLLYRKNDKVRFTGFATPEINLDSLPLPARHLLPMEKYKIGTLDGVKNFTSITTTRGCPFKCIFCSTVLLSKKIYSRTPRLAVDEIKRVMDKYNIKHFIFTDETLPKKHFSEICDLIIEEKLGITFEGNTRANLVDERFIAKMAKAGLTRIIYGLESANEYMREIMRKKVPIESHREANRLTNKYGIEIINSCMIGLPGETEETIRQTLYFLRQARDVQQANIAIAVPYPGTALLEMAKREEHGLKLMTDDFSKFVRYNSATMQVGDLSPRDLLRLQNNAFVSVYAAPWRWIPMLKKMGIWGAWLTFSRLLKSIKNNEVDFLTNKQLNRRRS